MREIAHFNRHISEQANGCPLKSMCFWRRLCGALIIVGFQKIAMNIAFKIYLKKVNSNYLHLIEKI